MVRKPPHPHPLPQGGEVYRPESRGTYGGGELHKDPFSPTLVGRSKETSSPLYVGERMEVRGRNNIYQ